MSERPRDEDGSACWLRYEPVQKVALLDEYRSVCQRITCTADVADTVALAELTRGLAGMLGIQPEVSAGDRGGAPHLRLERSAAPGGGSNDRRDPVGAFSIRAAQEDGDHSLVITGDSEPGLIYGVFAFLRLLQTRKPIRNLDIADGPACLLRMLDEWDNADGSVERGYSGRSIFFRENRLVRSAERITEYARLLASVGINAVSINNVNVWDTETRLVSAEFLPDVARVAAVLRPYGIALYLSINFASPIALGGLRTADPRDTAVAKFWKDTVAEVYRAIPDFGGFLVKADSEDRPGPHTYGRDHAEGANVIADALAPHGGRLIWRCFVYNCRQDWRDRTTDRACAAYESFMPLDGSFRDNVALQIKNGPMDFQVREPVSPLIGAMARTNQVVEFQVTQEYTGQQRHVCYLVPQWKQVLEFDTHAKGPGCTVAGIAQGQTRPMSIFGIAGVSNIGSDINWTGHHLAQANLYGFGRLAWAPGLSAETITDEWVRMTFGNHPGVVATTSLMLLSSWKTYERYTAPLGVGWMVTPGVHYGPSVDGYEYSRWGTYHFADRDGIGVDRTREHGSGFAGQYFEPYRSEFESLERCPEQLLLFFHHVPYTHRLRDGTTVIQHIYDTHFRGVEEVVAMRGEWMDLEPLVDHRRHSEVLARLDEQLESAREWRDVINTYFLRKSGIPDGHGRLIHR